MERTENSGAYQSGTSKTRHGTQVRSLNTPGESPQPAKSTTPTTRYAGWMLLRRSTSACTRNGTQGDEEGGLDSDEVVAIRVKR